MDHVIYHTNRLRLSAPDSADLKDAYTHYMLSGFMPETAIQYALRDIGQEYDTLGDIQRIGQYVEDESSPPPSGED